MNLRWSIVPPKAADTSNENDNWHKEWDAKQIIEVIVKKAGIALPLNDVAVEPVQHK